MATESKRATHECTGLAPTPEEHEEVDTPGESGDTPARAANASATIDDEAPLSIIARAGCPFTRIGTTILSSSSIGTDGASRSQYASGASLQLRGWKRRTTPF